jgi:hypothetical protein
MDRGRSIPRKAAAGGTNNSSSGETGGTGEGTYDLGLSPGCTNAGDGGTNNETSEETRGDGL